MRKRQIIYIIICFAIISSFFVFLYWVSAKQQQLTYYDQGSYNPYGLKALVLLLNKDGFQIAKAENPPSDHARTVLLLSTGKISREKRRELLHWVREGGIVVELTSEKPGLYLGAAPDENPNYESTNLPITEGFQAQFPSAAEGITYNPRKRPITTVRNPDKGFFSYQDRYFCYQTYYGKGSIVSWNDLGGLTNMSVKEYPDNAVAFILCLQNVAPSRKLALINLTQSEFRLQPLANLADLFDRYGSAFFLFLAAISLLLWKLAVRFGRPRPLVLAQGRSYHEFLTSMAGLFQQAAIKQVVLTNLWRALLRIIVDLTGLPATTDLDIQLAKLSSLTGKDYDVIRQLYQQLQNYETSRGQFLETAHKLDYYRRELIQWKTSRIW